MPYTNYSSLQSSDDLDNYKTAGMFFIWSQKPANAPIDYGVMYVKRLEGQIMQVCSRKSYAVEKIFYRNYESSRWGEWQELATNVPDFYKDYNSLSALASAVLSNSGESGNYNVNTLINTCFYYCRENSTNLPTNAHHFLLVFGMGSGNVIQIAYNYSSFKLYIRVSGTTGSTWFDWKSITLS